MKIINQAVKKTQDAVIALHFRLKLSIDQEAYSIKRVTWHMSYVKHSVITDYTDYYFVIMSMEWVKEEL